MGVDHHRAVKLPDLLIAAVAEAEGLTVIWMRLPQVSSNAAITRSPRSVGGWVTSSRGSWLK